MKLTPIGLFVAFFALGSIAGGAVGYKRRPSTMLGKAIAGTSITIATSTTTFGLSALVYSCGDQVLQGYDPGTKRVSRLIAAGISSAAISDPFVDVVLAIVGGSNVGLTVKSIGEKYKSNGSVWKQVLAMIGGTISGWSLGYWLASADCDSPDLLRYLSVAENWKAISRGYFRAKVVEIRYRTCTKCKLDAAKQSAAELITSTPTVAVARYIPIQRSLPILEKLAESADHMPTNQDFWQLEYADTAAREMGTMHPDLCKGCELKEHE